MALDDTPNIDRWVADRMAALTTDPWQPDTPARLAQTHRRRKLVAARRLRWAGVALATTIVCVSLPVTRAFGARCVEACVNATSRVSQWWRADEPAASMPRVVGADVGDLAPDLVGTDVDGARVELSSLRGHVIVLNFWATWCGPCKAEASILNDIQARFGAQGLDVIGVSIDEDGWTAVSPFAAQEHVGYRLALANEGVTAAYGGVREVPLTFVIDREGRIVVKRVGALVQDAEADTIAKLLGRQ